MLAILTSATLSKDIRSLDDALDADTGALVWYGHRVTIEWRKCVVLMEAASRYGVLFTALTKPDFQRLGERLAARLPGELARIHGDTAIAERLGPVVDRLADPIDPFRSRSARRRSFTDIGTFQFRIELLKAQPPIWRRFRVPANLPLEDLHEVIQIVMGWTDSHLHEFIVGEQRYGEASDEWPDPDRAPADEQQFQIDQLVSRPGEHLEYLYDFGDHWEHRLTLEAVDPPGAHAEPIECLDGARRCPPEDVGGLHGYIEFLEAVRNPTHPDHGNMLRWAGGEFDPEDFDPEAINTEPARRIEQDAARS